MILPLNPLEFALRVFPLRQIKKNLYPRKITQPLTNLKVV